MPHTTRFTKYQLDRFLQGEDFHCYKALGAHRETYGGQTGYAFAVWAPFAKSVRVTGEFDNWEGSSFYMEPVGTTGVWEAFIPDVLREGMLYKFMIETESGEILYKADPFAFCAEQRPGTASRLADLSYKWGDEEWLKQRKQQNHFEQPMNIYEVHLGSWKQRGPRKEGRREGEDPVFYTYGDMADELVSYVKDMGYTHVEFLPVMEHPFDGSWGYQITGYYAPTSRYGTAAEFKHLVDRFHQEGIGVILDWVPGHFCRDAHGLCQFNGQRLYEIEEHLEWGTYKFDFGRPEIQSFLISNAVYWIEEYHADGIRVDGVTSMLYLNYGVGDEGKRYNDFGGEEDLAAKAFLQKCNNAIGKLFPDVFTIAEESTAWPLVTYPPGEGGLGFHYKWDMGWMNDTLKYSALDFPFRDGSHNLLTFSMMYAFNENFILPLSHDEVVHGKCSLIERMPGDYWRKFAGLRLLLFYQMCHSGAKLNFMGNEFGQFIEWRFYEELEWFLLDYETHAKHQGFVRSINHFYLDHPTLWQQNYTWDGYEWIEADDRDQSILIFKRKGKEPEDFLIILINFLPDTYQKFKIGVPEAGVYRELLNSDNMEFGGSGQINPNPLETQEGAMHGQEQYIEITVPPIAGTVIAPESLTAKKTAETEATEKTT